MSDLIVLRKNSVDGVLLPADLNAAEDTIWTSAPQLATISSSTYRSMRLTFVWRALVDPAGNGEFRVNGVLEGKDEDIAGAAEWSAVGYTFNSFDRVEPVKRDDVIIAQPRVNWADGGVPNGFFIGGVTVAQVSYNPTELPKRWRARIAVKKSSVSEFVRLNCDVYAELYNPRGA